MRGVKDVCKTVQSKEAKSNLEDMDDSGLVQEGTSCGKNMVSFFGLQRICLVNFLKQNSY